MVKPIQAQKGQNLGTGIADQNENDQLEYPKDDISQSYIEKRTIHIIWHIGKHD